MSSVICCMKKITYTNDTVGLVKIVYFLDQLPFVQLKMLFSWFHTQRGQLSVKQNTPFSIQYFKTETTCHIQKNQSCVRKNIHVLREWVMKLTFNWAKAVKAVTKASSSSVSAVFMDTLMMWIGFSLVFCRGWKRNLWLQRHHWQQTFLLIRQWLLHTRSAHLDVLLLVQTRTGLWEGSTLHQRFCKAGEDLIKISAKEKETHQQATTYFDLHIFGIN